MTDYAKELDEKLINFENFCGWHNPDNTTSDQKLIEAYKIYKTLFEHGGKDFADSEICGHEIWGI